MDGETVDAVDFLTWLMSGHLVEIDHWCYEADQIPRLIEAYQARSESL